MATPSAQDIGAAAPVYPHDIKKSSTENQDGEVKPEVLQSHSSEGELNLFERKAALVNA